MLIEQLKLTMTSKNLNKDGMKMKRLQKQKIPIVAFCHLTS